MTGRLSDDAWMDARIRIQQDDAERTHAECFTEMLKGIADVAAKQLKNYGMGISDSEVTNWLGGVHDDLMDNLLWQEWGNASDLLPSDRKAWLEQIWKAAKSNLSRADLSTVDLSGADLSEARGGIYRTDGYLFWIIQTDDGPHIRAGCRWLSLPDARKHWQDTRGGTPLGDETMRILDFLESEAKAAGWIK